MPKLLRLLKKIDENLLKIFVSIFIFFIPLWPKIPLKTINYTYIALRLDDLFVAFLTLVFFIQLLRKKGVLEKKFFWLIVAFWLSVFLSAFWGIFIQKTIQFSHLGLLHALRRIEYMIVFFIGFAVIKKREDFFYFLKIYFSSVFLVVLYGLGQKFLNFPAVQTMNPEFAKGYLLYLTPEARVSSTFAGHYDLASYIVFAIPLILSFYFFTNKKYYLFLFVISLIVLIYTASRISFGAYIFSTFAFLLLLRKYWFTIFVLILTSFLILTTGELTKRFLKTFQIRRILVDEKTGAVYIGQKITTKELPAGSFYVRLKDKMNIKDNINLDLYKKQILEEKLKEATKNTQITLTEKEKEKILASLSANLKPVNTVVSDISFATRLQIEWPRALNAFKKNPFLGTGPSSLTEATDNDYLRWLGEFGLLGTTLFLLILGKIFFLFFKKIPVFYFGYSFSLLALLFNATYIDVFEASKVAYIFWLITGFFIAHLYYDKK